MLVGQAADAPVGADVLVELLVNQGAAGLERVAREVVVRNAGVPADAVGAWLGALRWGVREPTFPFGVTIAGGDRPFVVLDGDLRVRPTGPTSSSLHLAASYEPPFDTERSADPVDPVVTSIADGLVHGLVTSVAPMPLRS